MGARREFNRRLDLDGKAQTGAKEETLRDLQERKERSGQRVKGTVFQTEGTAGVRESGSEGAHETRRAQIMQDLKAKSRILCFQLILFKPLSIIVSLIRSKNLSVPELIRS